MRAGHVNEKNFVGLSVTSDGHIACGSEDNAVYAYLKALPLPIAKLHFAPPSGSCPEASPEQQHFVSSVCWSWRGTTLIGANSAGTTQVLKLVAS